MGGGMVAPMPQPTYMDLMPQQMGIPREAQGIMASSQPLVDAIAGDANNPAGGDTLSMAQGGIAKFQQGGGARRLPSDFLPPPYAPKAGPRTQIGIGAAPEDMLRRRGTTPSELVNEMFPYSASTGRSFLGPEMMRPGFVGTDPRGEASPIERGAQFIVDFIDQAGRGLSQVSNALGRTMVDIGEGLVTRAPQDVGTSTIISQVSAVNDALRRMPKVRGVSDEELGATIKDIAEAATTAQPGISGDELSARIAEGVLSKYEGSLSEGYAMARDDANRGVVDAAPPEGFPTPQLGYKMAAEDADRTLVDGVAEAEYQNELNSKIEEYRIAMAESARPGGNPDAQMKFTQELLANPNYDQSFKNAVLEAGDVGFSEEPAEAPVTGDESTRDVPRPEEKPPAPENLFEGLVPRGEEQAATDASEAAAMDDTIMGGATPDAAAQVAKAFDKPMTEPEAKKTIEDYKRRFMEAMPEYKGVSEEEKGYRFIEAGLRVMAGQSPNAIENIANGLKGLGAEFAKDEKEKRAYERQVDLSASKYALEGIQRDEAAAQALAKEKRGLFNKIFVVRKGQSFEYNGKMYNEGDRIIPTVGSLQDGTFPIDAVSSEAFSLEQIKSDRAALRAQTERLFKKVESPKNFVKSQTEYINASTQIKANIAISNLLKEAVVPLQAGKVTGGLNALRAFAQRVENFTGLKIPYADETPDAYRDKVGRAITANITSLLNEGNRTVSDADRTRAEEIGGLYANTLLAPTTKSANLLTEKLRAFEESIQRNNSKNIGIMSGIENAWNGTLNNQLQDYGDILRKSRGDLGSTARRATPGSRRTVRWTDIISVDPDNPSTLSFKPDWFRGK